MESSSPLMAEEKRKPRTPATPAEDAEVIALSPATLTATSRFFCDICGKGFQREQNLQLHRRSHNLPWELKQRTGKAAAEAKVAAKRVYVCPVPSCAHHDPAKALGDLSGIKKHFCRKHGEKKFSCHDCGKKYAVQSDIRAHAKICATKTHHCECGALFNKWDNFTKHKKYCDLLAQAIANHQANTSAAAEPPSSSSLQPPPSLTLSMAASSPVPSGPQSSALTEFPASPASGGAVSSVKLTVGDSPSTSSIPAKQSLFSKAIATRSDVFCAPMDPTVPLYFLSPPHLATNPSSSQYVAAARPQPPPALSATALLQQATLVGSTFSRGSFLHGLGLSMLMSDFNPQNDALKWNAYAKPENTPMVSSGGLPNSMVDRPSPAMIFSNQQLQTLDFLGVGGGNGNGNGNGDGGDAPFFGRLDFP